ncbi:hypothetical protein NQ176_g2202 [Zarea fungicola]|uniref:Uncharacterized protein n=1 Tax=Zarea fungicola TaxID=93591 RepID=A0ACC1NRQ0_9HYPO|nr:hypothetical protein NQ176_g2202 [Lecanicillium fungicola]
MIVIIYRRHYKGPVVELTFLGIPAIESSHVSWWVCYGVCGLNDSVEENGWDATVINQGDVPIDPADLKRTLTRRTTDAELCVEKEEERDSYEHYKRLGLVGVIVRLVKESPDLAWAYVLTIFGCIGACAAFPGQAILVANTVEVFTLTGGAMLHKGDFCASMFIVLAVGCFTSYFILGWTLSHKFRRQSLNDMLRQDLQFFDQPENNTGSLASLVDSNPQSILELMGINVGLIFVAVLNVVGCSTLAIAYSWRLGLVAVFAGMPPLLICGWLKVRFDSRLDDQLSDRYAKSAAIASDAVTAIRTVSSLAIEETVLERYTEELDQV